MYACTERLPSTPGKYSTYAPNWGFEISEWDGTQWITTQNHGNKIEQWSPVQGGREQGTLRRTKPNSLSVVVTGRNDNYDGDFDIRLITAMERNMEQLPEAEFIYVCWNPIPNRPLLATKLKKQFPKLKCFVVHPKFHARYCTIDGFLEYPAKNVGIRRSSGEYILSTNSDVIVSPIVAEEMRYSLLQKEEIYRASRVDIPKKIINVRFPLNPEEILAVHDGLTDASGDFLLLHRDTWNKLTGYCEAFPEQRLHKDSFAVYILNEIFGYPWKHLGPASHWRHESSWSSSIQRTNIGDINWDYKTCQFSKNKEDWGLTYTREEERDGIVWLV